MAISDIGKNTIRGKINLLKAEIAVLDGQVDSLNAEKDKIIAIRVIKRQELQDLKTDIGE